MKHCNDAQPLESPRAHFVSVTRLTAALLITWISPCSYLKAEESPTIYKVGTAKVDITPAHPIRLNGFGFRRTESEGVYQRIWARAIAIDDATNGPALLIAVDILGIPIEIKREVGKRLERKSGLKPERLTITASHTHTAPMLSGANPTIFGQPIPADHTANIRKYTAHFTDMLEQAGANALASLRPARLSWAIGSVNFASNRRTKGGPVDHDLPILVANDLQGKVIAIQASYACHCVTLSHNKIGGDWAGFAQDSIEDDFPGSVALMSIGCGADQNPTSGVTGDKLEVAALQGKAISAEVKRLTAGFLAPVTGKLIIQNDSVRLPFIELPSREDWTARSARNDAIGYHAKVQLDKIARGEVLPQSVAYPLQFWQFGNQNAIVFLPGEVVVDYSLRFKKELDPGRVAIIAYANDAPCYIPSERVLKEGGYEGGGAMIYYDQPAEFRPGLESVISDAVVRTLSRDFRIPFDPEKTSSSLPLSPWQSLSTIQTKKGLRIELVAAEPLVSDPVAIDFGPDGRLWVVEMADYPKGKSGQFEPGGRIRILEDSDGDGQLDRSTVFLDKIPFPTGITVYRGGVLICAAPDILYAEDTNGDGRADIVKKIFTGFGTENYQARVNSLCYGLDGWIYGSCGLFGGTIRATGLRSEKSMEPLALGNRDFRIRPDTGEIEPASGRTQQGRCRDDWGNWFGCDNSNLIWHYPLDDSYLRRNQYLPIPNSPTLVPKGGDVNQLFPLSRTAQRFRLSGPSNRTTAACGLEIYRDDILGLEYRGNSFTCEPVNLLVHRRCLKPSRATFEGHRAASETDCEFLASTDTWFRPVQVKTGPDGALWIVDMYRFVIEHPRWIPPEDLAKLDTRAGAGLGRIYRVVPADRQCRKWCRFDSSDVSQIVRAMDSPNGWQRDMAMMQLIWRNDKRSIPWLEDILRASSHPEARVSALCTLNALTSLSSKLIQLAMRDRNAGVRFHAVRIASALQHSDANIQTMIVTASSDVDSFVRLQAVYALGGSDSAEGSRCLARLANDCRDDAILSAAIWSGLSIRNLGRFIEEINSRNAPTVDFIERLGTFVSACGTPSHLHSFLEKLSSPNSQFPAAWQVAGVVTINDGISKNGLAGDAVKARLEEMIRNWADKARVQLRTNPNSEVSPWNIRLLGRESGKIQDDVNLIVSMIQPGVSAAMHGLALRECERINSRYVPQRLIAVWDKLAPMTKTQVLSVLLSREDWLTTFLEAVETRRILSSEIPAAIRQRLLSVSNPVYRERASKALNRQATENPDKLIARYESVLRGGGRAERGKDVFARVCSACHALNGVGTSIGPDLAAIGRRDRRTIVQEIVDPNRSVDPRYFEYQIVLKSGRELRGIIESESAAAVSMVASDGKREVIARQDVEDISSLKRSLMPEGLDRDITIYEMADLLAFVESAGRRPKQLVGNLPKTVKAVSGVYRLEAQHAEIYGQDITFEHGFWNIGHWHAESDTVLWKIDIDKHGEYDVYIDYACESRVSGNGLTITFADEKIDWIVKSTGDWSNYAQTRVGSVRIRPGNWELVVFASQPIRGALLDLRSVYLVPKGFALAKLPNAKGDDLTNVLQRLKDPATDNKVRQALIERNVNDSPRLVELLTNDLGGDTAEEYRRIPLIWQISITAAKKNEADVVRRLLDGSLPATRDGRLRDWQAVVIGGGIINGLSIIGEWPANRVGKIIGEHPALKDRLMGAVSQASRLADNETIPTSTRYDLLRMVALDSDDRNLRLLAKYLRKGVHPELQMGAVSGLNDIPSPKVEDLLLQSIQELTGTNRGMAIDALLRSESRMIRLLDAIERDVLPSEWVSDSQRRVMLDSKNTSIAKRASRVLTAKD